MADRGDVGRVIWVPTHLSCRSGLTLGVQPNGNVVTNVAADATPLAWVVLLDDLGGKMDQARVNSGGVWTIYDLGPGEYRVVELGSTNQWSVVVAADLTATVTKYTSARTSVYGFA